MAEERDEIDELSTAQRAALRAVEETASRLEALQHLKQLWHVLVHHGAPARPSFPQ